RLYRNSLAPVAPPSASWASLRVRQDSRPTDVAHTGDGLRAVFSPSHGFLNGLLGVSAHTFYLSRTWQTFVVAGAPLSALPSLLVSPLLGVVLIASIAGVAIVALRFYTIEVRPDG